MSEDPCGLDPQVFITLDTFRQFILQTYCAIAENLGGDPNVLPCSQLEAYQGVDAWRQGTLQVLCQIAGLTDGLTQDMLEFFKKDGSRAATGAFDMALNRITNLAAPTSANDAARLADIPGPPDLSAYFQKDGSVKATGAFDMDTHKVENLAAPTNPNDAARLTDIPSAPDLSPYFQKDGSVKATGAFDMDTHKLENLAAPTNPNDAARLADCGGGAAAVQWDVTEKTWTLEKDSSGNTLYCKEIAVPALPNAGTVSIAHGIAGLTMSKVFRLSGMWYSGSQAAPLPYVDTNGTYNVKLGIDATNIVLASNADMHTNSGVVRVIYAK